MPARKDDGQGPAGSSRPTPIWRLPVAQGRDASDTSDAPAGEADRPPPRRVPQPVVWGLAAALVCVGLYAAWATVGPDILGTSGAPDVAATTASGAPAGVGSADGGADSAPPADDVGAPLVVAEEDAEGGARAEPLEDPVAAVGADQAAVETESAEDATAAVVAPQQSEPALPTDAAAESMSTASDSPSVSSARAEGGSEAIAPAASPPVDEDAPPGDVADAPIQAAGGTAAEALPRDPSPAPIDVGADALGMVNARLDALETVSAGALGAGAAMTSLEQRVRALEQDSAREGFGRALAAWEEQRAALEAALADVHARLARFEEEASRQAAADGRLVGLVLATGDLTAALGSARPFAPMLDTLRGVAGEDAEIESVFAGLAPFAATGVPTLDGLKARFPKAANAIVRGASATEDADWIDETVTRLSQLVTIRRTGGAIDPESLDGRLLEAESALATGDLERAIAIVEALVRETGEAGGAGPWLRDSRARAAADDALARLVAIVHARIGARWASTGGAQ